MTLKLYKAGEVCDLVQVQPYVLRSWEKEFPGIGIQKSPESPRLYRQIDLEHVQQIKQLVFVEGLTVSGAKRRLDEAMPVMSAESASDAAEVLDALSSDARARLARVRDGLREIRALLSAAPGSSNGVGRTSNGVGRALSGPPERSGQREFELKPPSAKPARAKARPAAARSKTVKRRVVAKATASAVRKKTQTTKRKRAHA